MTRKSITIEQRARHPRIIYLVEKCKDHQRILDAIFEESYTRWGGLKTLIVPVSTGNISEQYLRWIISSDPDVIYSYAKIANDLIDKLHKATKPFVFLNHKNHENQSGTLKNNFRPKYYNKWVNTLSLIPHAIEFDNFRYSSNKVTFRKKLLSKGVENIDNRFFADNFGFFPEHDTGKVIGKINDASLLCLKAMNENEKARNAKESMADLLLGMTKNGSRVYTPSCMAGKNLLHPEVEFPLDCMGLKLFVGDSFEDRISFWNARHNYQEGRDINPSFLSMRIPVECLNDDAFIEALGLYS